MACGLRVRKDDIPKLTPKEKSWACDECGVLSMGEKRPRCRKQVWGEMKARVASAQADAHLRGLDDKGV